MKIGILGCTCDPPHKEHIAIGEEARKTVGLDRIILVPAKAPPHKDPPLVPPETRLAMARLAVQGLSGWEVSDLEFERAGKSYTKDTIAALRARYPDDELFYIVGADAIVSMPWKWNGGYDVLDLCKFIVAPRAGFPLGAVSENILRKIIVLKKAGTDISSTKVRESLPEHEKVADVLNPAVLQFIRSNKLYIRPTA